MSGALAELADDFRRNQYKPKLHPGRKPTARQKKGARRALAALDAAKRVSDPRVPQEVVSRHLTRYTHNQTLPPLIARFLNGHWRSLLVRLYTSEGENGSNWRNALDATKKLAWSVRPKRSEESRHRLFALLPELFEWVHAALELQQVGTSEEDAFFAELSRLHAATLRAEVSPVAAPPAEKPKAPPVAAPPAKKPKAPPTKAKLPEDDRDASELGAEASRKEEKAPSQTREDSASTAKNAEAGPLSSLRIGARVEFFHGRETKRMLRLKWISRLGNVFHFQDQATNDELCVTAVRLTQHLRENSARILT